VYVQCGAIVSLIYYRNKYIFEPNGVLIANINGLNDK
jgi:hypothetical protein